MSDSKPPTIKVGPYILQICNACGSLFSVLRVRMGGWSQPKATLQSVHVLKLHRLHPQNILKHPSPNLVFVFPFPLCSPKWLRKARCSAPQWDNHAWHFTAFHFSLAIWSSFPPAFSMNTAFCCSEESELAPLFRRES